jgi:hypothetical protein
MDESEIKAVLELPSAGLKSYRTTDGGKLTWELDDLLIAKVNGKYFLLPVCIIQGKEVSLGLGDTFVRPVLDISGNYTAWKKEWLLPEVSKLIEKPFDNFYKLKTLIDEDYEIKSPPDVLAECNDDEMHKEDSSDTEGC